MEIEMDIHRRRRNDGACCIGCGHEIGRSLAQLGSLFCHDCRRQQHGLMSGPAAQGVEAPNREAGPAV